MARIYGSKYTPGLTRKAAAVAIRRDIAAAIEAGDLPKGLRVSVRCTGGKGVRLQITAAPFGLVNPASVLWHLHEASRLVYGTASAGPDRLTVKARRVCDRLAAIADEYNFDGPRSGPRGSRGVLFYSDTDVAPDTYRAQREAWIAGNADLIADFKVTLRHDQALAARMVASVDAGLTDGPVHAYTLQTVA